jgi:DNA-binding transcriptional regulator YbjK
MQPPNEGTRHKIIEAALETLKEEGFTRCTSRAVAQRGGFNQALVFYYFGSMDALLLAALDRTNEQRLATYRRELSHVKTVEEGAAIARRLYEDDLESGHITVVSQMIAGSIARPELAPEMITRMQPWLDLCEQVVGKMLGGSPLEAAIPTRELAYAIVTFYLGANLVTQLDPARTRRNALFDRLEKLGPVIAELTE